MESALSDGPQVITRRGEETVVVLSMRDFRQAQPGRVEKPRRGPLGEELPQASDGVAIQRRPFVGGDERVRRVALQRDPESAELDAVPGPPAEVTQHPPGRDR